jgi:hypothetical protein
LVSYVLQRILANAFQQRYLNGICLDQYNTHIMNLYFANDTLLFLEASEQNMQTSKWILVGFKNTSSMKVKNFKCEMIPFNLSPEVGQQLASLFGCTLGSLPSLIWILHFTRKIYL